MLFLPLLSVLLPLFFYAEASNQWFPPLPAPVKLNSLFRSVDAPKLQQQFIAQFTKNLKSAGGHASTIKASNFMWTSTTMMMESSANRTAWVIAAGATPKTNRTGNAFTNEFSAVFGCQLRNDPKEPSAFRLDACEMLGLDIGSPELNHSDAGILGKGLQSLELTSGVSVLAYCDPTWHTLQGTQSPGGRCYIRSRSSNAWSSPSHIDFCNSAGHSQPCAGGFSVDLRPSDSGTDAQLLAGLPIALPSRRVRTISGLLKNSTRVRDIASSDENFAASVAWTLHPSSRSDAFAIVASPPKAVYGYRVNEGFDENAKPVLHMQGGSEAFDGFGFAVETTLAWDGLVVYSGAPYERSASTGANTGRVYVQCSNNQGSKNSSLTGSRGGEMFGYAVARIGDVDGDKVEDLAISAPALGSSGLPGRVYIHCLRTGCELDEKPFQILEGHPDVRGFGVSISRSVDVDADGGPEISVTTLDPSHPVLLYSLPRRLRTTCVFKRGVDVDPTAISAGSKIRLQFYVNFMNAVNGDVFPVPEGFLKRQHQLNPDVLWLAQGDQQSNQSDFESTIEDFFSVKQSHKLDPKMPRFTLESLTWRNSTNGGIVRFEATITAATAGKLMGLDIVPLHVAFRSVLADPKCSDYSPECPKSDQPLIDWSGCVWKMPPPTYVCLPHKECSADLQLSTQSDASDMRVTVGHRGETNFTVKFLLSNLGPTKSEGVRVELRALGLPTNSTQLGVRTHITCVTVKDPKTESVLAISGRNSNEGRWSVSIAPNEAAALISARQGNTLYYQQNVLIVVNLVLSGLTKTWFGDRDGAGEYFPRNLSNPGLQAKVLASIADPQLANNVAEINFTVVYKPKVRINAASAPPAIVDGRKNKPYLNSNAVFGHDVGPRLEHDFLVENFGVTDLYNLTFHLDVPVSTDCGHTLFYLTRQARLFDNDVGGYKWVNMLPKIVSAKGVEVGYCDLDSQFINPLNLTIRDAQTEGVTRTPKRSRRSVDGYPESSSKVHPLFPSTVTLTSPNADNRVTVHFKRSSQRQTPISCTYFHQKGPLHQELDFKVVCARIKCHLPKLPQTDTVRVILTGWLWTPSFFDLHLPDIKFVSQLSLASWGPKPPILDAYPSAVLDYPEFPPIYGMSQAVVFRGVAGRFLDRVPLWPILVGVILGSILLFGLMASLYCCGFFRRRQKTKEAKRRSMMAASRRIRNSGLTKDTHPTTALLLEGLRNGSNHGGIAANGKEALVYTANPLHVGSDNLIYAVEPQPPTPPATTTDDETMDLLLNESPEQLPIETPSQPLLVGQLEPVEVVISDNETTADAPSPASSSDLPDWLLKELKDNEANSKKSKPKE